jgi:hypothetical protein
VCKHEEITSASNIHEDVIWMYIENTEGLAVNEVDEVIDMDITEDRDGGSRCSEVVTGASCGLLHVDNWHPVDQRYLIYL